MDKFDQSLFKDLSKSDLEKIYIEVQKGKEVGLRPRILDPYIYIIKNKYPLTFGEALKYTEDLFWEEVGRRYFKEDN